MLEEMENITSSESKGKLNRGMFEVFYRALVLLLFIGVPWYVVVQIGRDTFWYIPSVPSAMISNGTKSASRGVSSLRRETRRVVAVAHFRMDILQRAAQGDNMSKFHHHLPPTSSN